MKFKDLPVEVQAIAANMLKDLYIFDQQDVNEERAKNLSKAFVALYQDSSAVNSDIATETGKLIKDSMGVYSAHLGESAKKPCAIARVVNIHIRNDVIGDRFFMPKVADTLIKYATMIKNTTAGRYSEEHFDDDNGNKVTIIGGRLSEEERLPSPALSDYFISSSKKM
ncbi:hypothetical protein ACEF99_002598 [Salmonella enterica subsp. enterica serovar Newport]